MHNFIFDRVRYLWFHSFVLGGGLHCNGVLVGHTSISSVALNVVRLFSWSHWDMRVAPCHFKETLLTYHTTIHMV